MVHHTSNLVFFFFCHCQIAQLDSRARFPVCLAAAIALQCLLAWLRKIPGGFGLGGSFSLLFFFFFPLSICLFVKVLKRWFGFDSFSSQPRKLWDQSAQRLCFSGLLALPCLWGREPRCLLQSPSRMAFLFIGDFKMSLIRISPKFKPSNFSLKQNHLSMQYLCT